MKPAWLMAFLILTGGFCRSSIAATKENDNTVGASAATTPSDVHDEALKASKIDVRPSDASMAGTNLPDSNTNTPRTRSARRNDYHKPEKSNGDDSKDVTR